MFGQTHTWKTRHMGSKCFSVEDQQMVRMLRVGPMILAVLEFSFRAAAWLGLTLHHKMNGKGGPERGSTSETSDPNPSLKIHALICLTTMVVYIN